MIFFYENCDECFINNHGWSVGEREKLRKRYLHNLSLTHTYIFLFSYIVFKVTTIHGFII